MASTATDYSFITVSELRAAIEKETGSKNLAHVYSEQAAMLWRGEVLDAVKFKKGLISAEDLRASREARWEHADRHSYWLAKNMMQSGRSDKARPSKDGSVAAHHIVSWYSREASQSRLILKAVGLDIDQAENGVWLPRFKRHVPHKAMPKAQAHTKTHTGSYYLNVFHLLRDTMAEGLGRQGIKDALDAIAEELTDGSFPLTSLIAQGH